MDYITQDEYKGIIGTDVVPDNFQELLNKASAELDVLTRFYYLYNELGDNVRDTMFKKAVAYQIKFYDDLGMTSAEEMNNAPDSISIGDTRVSNYVGLQRKEKRQTSISLDVMNLLAHTGLLYRGSRGGNYERLT